MPLESVPKIHSEPNLIKNFSEYGQILFIQLSPFECSQDLLLIAFSERIVIGQLELNVCQLILFGIYFITSEIKRLSDCDPVMFV